MKTATEEKHTAAKTPPARTPEVGNTQQLPTYNLDVEQCVLACVLLDNDACIGGFAHLSEDDFYSPAHKTIFAAMRSVYERSTPIDLITLTSTLADTGKLESVGGLNYLNQICDVVPSAASFRHYVAILKKHRTRRRLINASNKIIQATRGTDDEQTALRLAEKEIFDIAREDEHKELTAISSELPAVLERLDTIQKDPTAVRGLRTGFYGIDDLTNGLQKSDLIILAARPSVGKTSLGLNIVLNAAVKSGAKCAVFSLEMNKQSLATRALCGLARISMQKATKGQLDAEEWKRIWLANKELAKANIYIDDNSIITPAEITSKCMRLKREHGLDLVMIDYLGLMRGGAQRYDSRQQEVAENSRYMKMLAKELDVPVLLLSQLNRGIESRKGTDSTPVLSDLRDSGAIEQDADIVMFIHKEKSEGGDSSASESEEVQIIVAKHRNGPTGTVKLKWIGDWMTYTNLSHDQQAQDARDKASTAFNKADAQSAKPAAKQKPKPEALPPIV